MENALDSLVKYNNQTQGRDRLFRLVQYGSKLLWWLAEKYKYNEELIHKLKNLENTMGAARKLLRLGRSLDLLYGSLKMIHLPDLMLRVTLTMAKLNQALYFLMDHVVWLDRVGLIAVNKDKWGRRANKFWLLSILLQIARDVYELWHLMSLELRIRSHCSMQPSCGLPPTYGTYMESPMSTSTGYLHEEVFTIFGPVSRWTLNHQDVVLDTIKNGCDLVIPMAGLGHLNASPGVVGLCGVVSSVIGIVTIIHPLSRLQPS